MTSTGSDQAPVTRVESAYQQIREAIIGGEFPPGAPLRHQELTDALGVSLVPIREAMRMLEAERLVDSIPRKGARVATVSLDEVRDVYAIRIVLEVEALRRGWPRFDGGLLEGIRATRATMVDHVRRDDRRFYDLHRQVHFGLYERAESPWLLHLIEILWSHTERYRRIAGRLRSFVDEGADLHGKVLDAIEAGDLDAATRALRRDLERTAHLIFSAYQAEGPG